MDFKELHYHTDGTGLGMYIGKKIVAEHKGKIWAESDEKARGRDSFWNCR